MWTMFLFFVGTTLTILFSLHVCVMKVVCGGNLPGNFCKLLNIILVLPGVMALGQTYAFPEKAPTATPIALNTNKTPRLP